ncbi:MAG: hypothetical protein Q8Q15_01070, partial [bacterium]|nr:hypothetical protein [bacterium]
ELLQPPNGGCACLALQLGRASGGNSSFQSETAVATAYRLRGQKSLAFTVAYGDRKTILINKDCSLAKRLFRKTQQTFVLTPPPNIPTADCFRT